MKKIIVVSMLGLFLSGCTVPHTKTELKNYPLIKNELLKGNYQKLARCWDENAKKQNIDFKNATFITLYAELGIAEITIGGGDLTYGMIILEKESDSKTIMSAYGTGDLKTAIMNWASVIRKCSSSIENKTLTNHN
ncbi:MAG: hypothetical protein KAS75_07835 [Planctomycetes bacterium]|nr:hypothetical protein [Planctomycetota bacterium]